MLSFFHGVKDHVVDLGNSVIALGATMSGGKLENWYNLSELGKSAIAIIVLVAGAGIYYNKTSEHFDRLDQAVKELKETQSTSQTRIDTNIDAIKDKQQQQLITLTEIKTTLQNQAEVQSRKESYHPRYIARPELSASNEPRKLPEKTPPQSTDENSRLAYNYYTQDSPYQHR